MKIVRFVRSHAEVAYALVAVFLGAVALAALDPLFRIKPSARYGP
jgi:hypothetical protein